MKILEESIIFRFQKDFFSFYKKNKDLPSFTQIFLDNNLISESFNFVEEKKNQFLHSEVCSITKAKEKMNTKYLSNYTLITVLEPCLMCAGLIILSKIKKVVYFVENKKENAISSLNFETIQTKNHFPYLQFIENKQIAEVWTSFFKEKR